MPKSEEGNMLRANTVLTAVCVLLMGVLGFLTQQSLSKLDATHDSVIELNQRFSTMEDEVNDHANRIRDLELHFVARTKQPTNTIGYPY